MIGNRILLIFLAVKEILARELPPIFWNSSNPIFRVDNTDHVLSARISDRVEFRCPFYDKHVPLHDQRVEYSEIYQVSQQGYELCMRSTEDKFVGACDTPHLPRSIPLHFRIFTPLPNGINFTPGQTYYFISTSTGSSTGQQNDRNGLCKTKNMRIKIEVKKELSESEEEKVRPVVGESSHRGEHYKYVVGGEDRTEHASYIITDEYYPRPNKEKQQGKKSGAARRCSILSILIAFTLILSVAL